MKIGSSGNYGSSLNGYSTSTKPSKYSLYKNGLTGLKTSATPRGYYSGGVAGGANCGSIVGGGGGPGSDRDSINGRSRKGKSRKPIAATKLDPPLYKKKNYDFTDYAHKEAVNRLKFLLADSYTPTKLSSTSSFYNRHYEDSGDDTESQRSERPAISEISKYIPNNSNLSRYNTMKRNEYTPQKEQQSYLPSKSNISPLQSSYHSTLTNLQNLNLPSSGSNPISTNTEQQPPPELLTFIEKQESYIEQLERESQYCRGELSSLLNKVKDVISENEALTDQARTGLSRPFYPRNNDSSDSEETLEEYPNKNIKKFKTPLDGPNIVFESRISELEAQLAQANIDIKKIHEENENNKRKLANGGGGGGGSGGRFDSISIVGDDNLKKQIENMQRERQTQEDTIRKLMAEIAKLKDSDATNFSKTQRNRDLAEQAIFERTQSDLEIRRLKDELERQHERIRELQHEMAKRIAEERATAERRYNYQVDQLGGDLSNQWEHASKLQLELERQRRVEADYKRDLAQRTAQIEELKMEIKTKTTSFLSDLAQVNAEKQSLEQEIIAMRLQVERSDRQTKTETSRLNAEINSLRQRLDRADADLLHARRENLRLSDDVSNLEKEITLGDINREPRMTSKDMTKIISEMESKHATTVTELEGMVQGQRQLMEKLTDECKTLTHKLEDTTIKHKEPKGRKRVRFNTEPNEYERKYDYHEFEHNHTTVDSDATVKQRCADWYGIKQDYVEYPTPRTPTSIESSTPPSTPTAATTWNEMNALQTNVDYLTSKIISRDRIGNTNNNDNIDNNISTNNNNNNDNNISYSGSNLNNDDHYDEAPQYGNTNFSRRSEPRDNNTNVAPIRRDEPSTSINYKSRDGIISGQQSRNQSPQQSLVEKTFDINGDTGKRQISEDYVSQSPTQQQQRPGSRTGDRFYPKERPESRTGERLYTKEQEYSGTDSIKPDRQRSANVSPETDYRANTKTDGPKEVTYSEPSETEYNKSLKQNEPYNTQMEYPVANQYEGNYQYPTEPTQGYDPNQYQQYATEGYGYEAGEPQQYEPATTTGYDYQPQQYEQEYTQPSYRTDQYETQSFAQPQFTTTADTVPSQIGSGGGDTYAPTTTTTSQLPYGGSQSNTNTTTSGYNQPIQSNANMGSQPAREQRFIPDELSKPKQFSPPPQPTQQQQPQYKSPTAAAPVPSNEQPTKKFMPEQPPANFQNQPPGNNFNARPQPKQ